MRAVPALIAALGLLTFVAPALAQDDGYGYTFHENGDFTMSGFAGLRGSLAFSGTASTTVPTTPPTALRASYNTGGGGSVYIGTYLPLGLRLELEGFYRDLPFNQVQLNGTPSVAHGQAQIAGPMMNLFWDIPLPWDSPIKPFIGGGVGGAYVAASLTDPTDANTYFTSKNWSMAFDLMGGAALPLSPTSRFTAMYRWLRVNGVDGACGTTGAATMACSTALTSQSVDLGLQMDL